MESHSVLVVGELVMIVGALISLAGPELVRALIKIAVRWMAAGGRNLLSAHCAGLVKSKESSIADRNIILFAPRRTHKYEVDQRVRSERLGLGVITAASFRPSDFGIERNPGYWVRFENGRISPVMEPDLRPVLASPEELAQQAAIVVDRAAVVMVSQLDHAKAWLTKPSVRCDKSLRYRIVEPAVDAQCVHGPQAAKRSALDRHPIVERVSQMPLDGYRVTAA